MDDDEHVDVLVVGMMDSPHFVRWLEQFTGTSLKIRVFPSTPNRRIHPSLISMRSRKKSESCFQLTFSSQIARASVFITLLDLILRGNLRCYLLNREVRLYAPRLLHALELQHAGYLAENTLRRRQRQNAFNPKLMITNWGSDIFWYAKFPSHRLRLQRLISITNFYAAECHRDVQLAKELGYNGIVFPVGPNSAAFEFDTLPTLENLTPTSQRSVILVKGYTNFVGRAQFVLRVIRNLHLHNRWQIVVYSATLRARFICLLMKMQGYNIRAFPKRSLSHAEMMDLFGQARVYIGHSLSDGISTSFLEAMTVGAFPIQTSTACVQEWISKGVIVSETIPLNEEMLRASIQSALSDDTRVDLAARTNRRVVESELTQSVFRQRCIKMYSDALSK